MHLINRTIFIEYLYICNSLVLLDLWHKQRLPLLLQARPPHPNHMIYSTSVKVGKFYLIVLGGMRNQGNFITEIRDASYFRLQNKFLWTSYINCSYSAAVCMHTDPSAILQYLFIWENMTTKSSSIYQDGSCGYRASTFIVSLTCKIKSRPMNKQQVILPW